MSKKRRSNRPPPLSPSRRVTRSQTLAARMQKASSPNPRPQAQATASTSAPVFQDDILYLPSSIVKNGRVLNMDEILALGVGKPRVEPPISEIPWFTIFDNGEPPVSVLQQKPLFDVYPGQLRRIKEFWEAVKQPALGDPTSYILNRKPVSQEHIDAELRKGKSVMRPDLTIIRKAKQPWRSFFGIDRLASFLGFRDRQTEKLSEKETPTMTSLRPLVAQLPIFRESEVLVTRRHTDGRRPYSPKRLQQARRQIKSAECSVRKVDWSSSKCKSASRNLTPVFEALLRK